VRICSCLSNLYGQEMGVPQDVILSITLFLLKINIIINCLPVDMRGSLFVNDFCISFYSNCSIDSAMYQ